MYKKIKILKKKIKIMRIIKIKIKILSIVEIKISRKKINKKFIIFRIISKIYHHYQLKKLKKHKKMMIYKIKNK